MNTPPTGRIKDPLRGHKNTMAVPRQFRNGLTREEMILVPLETSTEIWGNREDILLLAPMEALHRIDRA